jgi:hypothetical protein
LTISLSRHLTGQGDFLNKRGKYTYGVIQVKISDYMKQTPAYSAKQWVSEMETLLQSSSASGHFPFSQDAPLPENTSLITGIHRYDLNAQRLELYAASIGVDRTLWIFAADAEILGLEVRNGQKPLMVFSNVIEGPDQEPRLDAHQVYLIDQCTPESLSRLPEYAHPESINPQDVSSRRRYLFAKTALLNIANYDAGFRDQSARLSTRNHIRENSDPHNPAFEDARCAYRQYTAHSHAGVFHALRSYYIRQVSGSPLNSRKQEPPLSPAALLKDIPNAICAMFNARIFVKRLENENFFLDYSRSNPPRAAFIRQAEPETRPVLSRSPHPERTRR